MSPVLRVGLVGFGQLARNYYSPALRAAPCPLRLHIADPAPESLEAAGRQWPDASRHRDHRDLLAAEPLDALLVASPPSTHLAVWRDAAARELPVFMEKPFPLARELSAIDPADVSWSRIMVDFNRRFWPPYQRVAGLVRARKVGAVKSARFCLRVDPRKWGTVSDHRALDGEGGALQDLGSQILDLAIMVLGEAPLHLRTVTASPNESYRVELDFGSDAVAHCEFGYSGRREESIRIEGERGVLRLDDPNFAVHHLRDASVLAHIGRRGRDATMLAYRALFRSRSMLRYTVREALFCFLQAVTRGTRMSPGIEDALRVARWLATVETAIGAAGVDRMLAA